MLPVDFVKNEYGISFLTDEPVLYEGFKIYPILVKDSMVYNRVKMAITINKNDTNEVSIISMSYIDFLIYLMKQEQVTNEKNDSMIGTMLTILLSLVLRIQKLRVRFDEDMNGKTVLRVISFEEGNEFDLKLSKNEFDMFRTIVLCQNEKGFKEEIMSGDLREELELKARMKNGGRKPCDMEKRICSVMYNTSMSLEEILNLTIRKFDILVEMIDRQVEYIIFKQASLHPMISSASGAIPHYLDEIDVTFEDKVITTDELNQKLKTSSISKGGNE